jgi:hypothetical protein
MFVNSTLRHSGMNVDPSGRDCMFKRKELYHLLNNSFEIISLIDTL